MLQEVWLEHLGSRDVNRNWHRLAIGHGSPATRAATGLLPHKEVEVVHLAAVLEHGYKLNGAYPTQRGVIPTREGLGTHNLTVGVVDLRLVPHLDLAVGEGLVYGLLYGNAAQIPLQILLGKAHQAALWVLARVAMRNGGIVHGQLVVGTLVVLLTQVVDAGREYCVVAYALLVQLTRQPFHQGKKCLVGLIVVHICGKQYEAVTTKTGNRQVLAQKALYALGNGTQDLVATQKSVLRVYRTEVTHVQKPQRHVLEFARPNQF